MCKVQAKCLFYIVRSIGFTALHHKTALTFAIYGVKNVSWNLKSNAQGQDIPGKKSLGCTFRHSFTSIGIYCQYIEICRHVNLMIQKKIWCSVQSLPHSHENWNSSFYKISCNSRSFLLFLSSFPFFFSKKSHCRHVRSLHAEDDAVFKFRLPKSSPFWTKHTLLSTILNFSTAPSLQSKENS